MATTLIPIPADVRVSQLIQQRALRWIMLGIVALAAFLVAVVGQPPAQPDGPGAHSGLVGVSQPGPLSSHG